MHKLTDQEIEQISQVLEQGKTPDSKFMEVLVNQNLAQSEEKSYLGIDENTEDKPYPHNVISKQVITTEKIFEIDPKTGNEVEAALNIESASLTEEIFDESDANINNGSDTLKSMGLTDEESVKLYDIITRFKNGEKFNIYQELPNGIKFMVRQLCANNMSRVNATAKDLLNHFIREMHLDNEFIDLQQSLQKELKLMNISEMYKDELKNNMEVELLKKADKLEETGANDKAELLRKVSAAFTDSYNFTTLIRVLNEDELIQKRISKDLTRYKRYVNDFNYKYENSKFNISNIKILEQILPEIMHKDNITIDDVKKFIIVICKVTKDMSPDNVEEHTFMYYTIQNIILLKHLDLEVSEFGKEIYNNLLNVIKLMKEVESVGSVRGNK